MTIGICTDHGRYTLKQIIHEFLIKMGYDVVDFGAFKHDNDDDYPDFVIPLALAFAARNVHRGIAICESGVGASIIANKVTGVLAADRITFRLTRVLKMMI